MVPLVYRKMPLKERFFESEFSVLTAFICRMLDYSELNLSGQGLGLMVGRCRV